MTEGNVIGFFLSFLLSERYRERGTKWNSMLFNELNSSVTKRWFISHFYKAELIKKKVEMLLILAFSLPV